jgi:hypothetical protein
MLSAKGACRFAGNGIGGVAHIRLKRAPEPLVPLKKVRRMNYQICKIPASAMRSKKV